MKYVSTMVLCLTMVGCGQFNTQGYVVEVPVPGPTVTVEVPAPAVPTNLVKELTDEENEYRLSLGQTMLTPGLSCTLYSYTGGSSLATLTGLSSKGSFLLTKEINQPDDVSSTRLNILPSGLANLLNQYMLRCTGYVVVTQNGMSDFEVSSDDGSRLYIDGSLVVNLDGTHGVQTMTGAKSMRQGVKAIKLEYFDIGGRQALTVKMNGSVLSPELYLH